MLFEIHQLVLNFVVVDERMTGRQAIDAAKGKTYTIIRFGADRFAVFKSDDLRSLLRMWKILDVALSDIPANTFERAFAHRIVSAIGQDSSDPADVERVEKLKANDFLVVLADGQVVGLLVGGKEVRGARPPKSIPKMESPGAKAEADVDKTAGARPELPAAEGAFGTLTDVDMSVEMAPPQPIPLEAEKRYINAEIEGHAKTEPLQMGQTYVLAFDVDTQLREAAVGGAEFGYRFQAGEEMVELTIQLSSDDFEIYTDPQKLKVPRSGKSKGKARFDVEPKHEGEGVINAVFLKEGNFIQIITLKLHTGAPSQAGVLKAETLGRPVEAAFEVQPRDLSLTILNTGTGFQVIMAGAVGAMATLPLTLAQLDQIITQVRQELKDIVYLEAGPQKTRFYQARIDIPVEVNQVALQRLAKAGFQLYRKIFYGPAADAQAKLLGDRLRQIALQEPLLKIQIFSQQFMLPWGILYMADKYDEKQIDPQSFLGLKHIIEHIPLQPNMQVTRCAVESQPHLTVSLNVNADIDQQMKTPLIANQVSDWQKIKQSTGIQLEVRKTVDVLTQALANATTPDNLLYFYCHAVSKALAEGGGPDASTLVLSGNGRVTLEDLNLQAPTDVILPGAPLVFINACESAELSPLFYDGFVPYFMAKGARGVIGTECETPALFAAEWAKRFFKHFLGGAPLGQAFLDLRREFYSQHNNLLGLLYALYCDGDTQIIPGLPVE
jgi:hypothetical protein